VKKTIKRDRIEFVGTVIDANKGQFKVKINDNYTVLCSLSGKIRQNSVKILVGDSVTCEVSEYDPSKGRIVFRHKKA
jgi:translation initiation factor IF-1